MTNITNFTSSQGPVNTGMGDQHVHLCTAQGHALPQDSQRRLRRLGADELQRLKQRFAPPPGIDVARRILEERSAVLLTSPKGCGAPTAARVLLCELPHGVHRFRELLDPAEREGPRALDPGQTLHRAPLLLDLSTAPASRYAAFMKELPGLLPAVRERNARLAVVLPQSWKDGLDPLLRDFVAPLGRPPEKEVLLKHLRLLDITPAPAEVAVPRLEEFLRDAPMAAIADLSEEIRFARDTARGGSGFGAWLDAALTVHEPGPESVDSLVGKLPTGRQRALLLTTALLHEARPDALHEATARLLRAAEQPDVAGPAFQHRPLTARLADVEAATCQDGRVRFGRLKYDARVRAFFWDNFPQLRAPLHAWVAEAADLPALTPGDRLNLVSRYVHERLRTGPPEAIIDLVQRWTPHSAGRREQAMAARALGEGVLHPRYGGTFRHTLYRWSRDTDLVPVRADVVISVCSEALSRRFPEQAMIRLRHLARHNRPAIRAAAREALRRITEPDEDHPLLHALLARLRPGPGTPGRHDAALFLHLADPAKLLRDRTADDLLAGHWAAALAALPRPEWEPQVLAWLAGAQAQLQVRERALAVIADACVLQRTAFSGVYAVACRWASGEPDRAAAVDALWQRTQAMPGDKTATATFAPSAKETCP